MGKAQKNIDGSGEWRYEFIQGDWYVLGHGQVLICIDEEDAQDLKRRMLRGVEVDEDGMEVFEGEDS